MRRSSPRDLDGRYRRQVGSAPRASPPSRSFWPGKCRGCAAEACGSIRGRRNRSRSRLRSLAQSRYAEALLGTWMGDTGGKSGRRPGRHLQVEASGPGNAAGVQQRLVGRFGGGEIAQGRACAVWLKVDTPKLSSGPGWEIQEVSRVGAQRVTSKSKLLAREMPRVCSRGLRVDSGAAKSIQVAPAQPGSKSMRRSSPRDLNGRYRR